MHSISDSTLERRPGPSGRMLALIAGLALVCLGACGDDDTPAADAGSTRDSGAGDAGGGDAGCIAQSGQCEGTGPGECCGDLVCRSSSTTAYCVQLLDTCFVGADPGCCLDDADCAVGERCHLAECRLGGEGMCKPVPDPDTCWSDRDCAAPLICDGASVCPCGFECLVEDSPGVCMAAAGP